ncbi:endoplasmic reticulum resident protein 44-like [Chrysoperla carnea]|uniref:endoplasmic reticulum resident protein 44-like n=1 Tax=Chrysoperla carnea TaxID=189513 RepID=UPI001D07C688|nr:endoplasmic reticulum resident protein 44-like [Chrysoperla carnea]
MGNYWSAEPTNCTVEPVNSYLYEITIENYQETIAKHEVVLLYIYTSWSCEYDHPIFEETAKRVHQLYPNGNVLIGRINAETEPYLAKNKKRNFNVKFFPFVKLFYNGKSKGNDYRGKRTVEHFIQLIEDVFKNPKLKVDDYKWE